MIPLILEGQIISEAEVTNKTAIVDSIVQALERGGASRIMCLGDRITFEGFLLPAGRRLGQLSVLNSIVMGEIVINSWSPLVVGYKCHRFGAVLLASVLILTIGFFLAQAAGYKAGCSFIAYTWVLLCGLGYLFDRMRFRSFIRRALHDAA